MQALKALVIIMGILIVAGFAVIGVELYNRMNDPERRDGVDRVAAGRSLLEVGLDLPAGTRIGEMLDVANRVVFRVSVPDGEDRLYILDPRTGAVLSTVTTGRAATAPARAEAAR